MYLTKGGGFSGHFTGAGAIPEGAALLYNGVVAGLAFELWFQPGTTPAH